MFWDIFGYICWGLLWFIVGLVAIAVIIVIVVLSAFLIDGLHARRTLDSVHSGNEWWSAKRKGPGNIRLEEDNYTPRNGKNHAFLSVPGILAKETHVVPLMPTLDQYDVSAFKYVGLRYFRDGVTYGGAAAVRFLLKNYNVVVLDGISHGGHGVARIMDELGPSERARVDVVLHDVPWGAETLKQVPGFAKKLFLLTPGHATNFVLGWVPKLFALGGPKRETVWTPSLENMFQLTGRQMTPGEFFAWVAECAKQDLSGHSFAMWFSEIGDMVRGGIEGLPMNGLLGARSVTYIAYVDDKNNEVVRQTDAVDEFRSRLPRMRVIERHGTHAGFRDDVDGNQSAMAEALPK